MPGRRLALMALLSLVLLAELAWLAHRWLAPVPVPAGAGVPVERVRLDPAMAVSAFSADAASPSSDGWRLLGVRKHPEPRRSTAVLVREDGQQRVFGRGESLADGLWLRDVGIDHVVLAGPDGARRLSLTAGAAVGAVPRPAAAPLAPLSPPPAVGAVRAEDLVREAGLTPRLVDGQVAGFTLVERGGGRALRAAGLRAGDVLVAVNGDALTPERLASFPETLRDGPLALTIERDGQRQTLSLPMESR